MNTLIHKATARIYGRIDQSDYSEFAPCEIVSVQSKNWVTVKFDHLHREEKIHLSMLQADGGIETIEQAIKKARG